MRAVRSARGLSRQRLEGASYELDGVGPLFEQLVRKLKRGILAGRYPSGSSLPATRTLAVTLGVSRNTVLGAYELLCAEGLAVAQPGSGTRVADTLPRRVASGTPESVPPQSRYSERIRVLGPIDASGPTSRPTYELRC